MPYIAMHMDIASETGTPIMRPMFFDYYEDDHCYDLDTQYMFGSDIIFAPILNEGQTEREVYLPKGKWILTNGKKEYEGEQTVFCHAELNEFIAFVKAGSEILKEFT